MSHLQEEVLPDGAHGQPGAEERGRHLPEGAGAHGWSRGRSRSRGRGRGAGGAGCYNGGEVRHTRGSPQTLLSGRLWSPLLRVSHIQEAPGTPSVPPGRGRSGPEGDVFMLSCTLLCFKSIRVFLMPLVSSIHSQERHKYLTFQARCQNNLSFLLGGDEERAHPTEEEPALPLWSQAGVWWHNCAHQGINKHTRDPRNTRRQNPSRPTVGV